jgi:hypothetical protein
MTLDIVSPIQGGGSAARTRDGRLKTTLTAIYVGVLIGVMISDAVL